MTSALPLNLQESHKREGARIVKHFSKLLRTLEPQGSLLIARADARNPSLRTAPFPR